MITLLSLIAIAGHGSGSPVPLEMPIPDGGSDAVLQYDDGTAAWMSWGGTYRAVLFDLEDFYPEPSSFTIDALEIWLYQPEGFSLGIWAGGECLFSTWTEGGLVDVEPPVEVEQEFRVIMNTEMSSSPPSLLADGTPNPTNHSFYSDDFIVWEPFTLGDYFIRVQGDPLLALESETWAAIKTLF